MKVANFLMIILVFLSLNAGAQLHVVQINGAIKKTDSTYLRIGDVISADTKLLYPGQHDYVRVVTPQGQISVLTTPVPPPFNPAITAPDTSVSANSIKGDTSKKRISALSDYIANFTETISASLKSNAITYVSDLKDMISFKKSKILRTIDNDTVSLKANVLIQDSNKYIVDLKKYPLTKGRFLLQSGNSQVTGSMRPLVVQGDTLNLTYKDFLAVGAQAGVQVYHVYYQRDSSSKSLKEYKNISPRFDITGDTRAFMYQMVKYPKPNLTKDQLYHDIYDQVSLIFGQPSDLVLRKQFESEYLIVNQLQQGPPLRRSASVTRIDHQSISLSDQQKALGNFVDTADKPVIPLQLYAPDAGDQLNSNSCTAWAVAYSAASINYNFQNDRSLEIMMNA